MNTTAATDSLLDVNGAAEYLNVKPSWLYSNVERLPTIRVGKLLRFRLSDLDEWLDGNRISV
jgi:excisionase family DNA binding protein